MTTPAPACPECNAPLRGTLAGGLCPRCVMRVTLTEEPEEAAAAEPSTNEPRRRFGDYELLRELGRGGMGVVYEARQLSLNRVVALKMLLPARLASPSELERFRLEAEAVAALDHPNILPLYEIGSSQGQPFFTMKLAEGGSLAQRLLNTDTPKTEPSARTEAFSDRPSASGVAKLVAHIAHAVHFAHLRGIQHRDLKPGNILLDAQDRPYVSDFGLAKFRDRDSDLTLSTTVLGSPAYMAPEQAAGDAKRVTIAADVYSLGAILYELLAGRPPFTGGSALEVLRKVREEEPLPPSRITDHELRTTNDRTSERANRKPRIVNAVDRDLEVICLKCLNKEPAKRYASAEALAEELDRWLAGEPIHARPITAAEVFTRWCRRRPALATAFAALVLVLVAGVTGVTRQWRRAEEHSRRWQLERYAADLQVASQALAGHDLGLARRMVAAQLPTPGEPDLRGFEWRLLASLCAGQHHLTLTGHTATVTCVALSPDGTLAASGGMDGTVRLWNTATGAPVTNLFIHRGVIWSVAFAADSQRLISAGNDGKVRFWTREGRPAAEPLDGQDAALSADGSRLAVSASAPFKYFSAARGVSVWDWRARKRIFQTNVAVRRVALSADGRQLAAAGARRDIYLWDIETGASRRLPTPDTVWALTFSSDGSRLAAAGFGNGALVWDLNSTNPPVALAGHQLKVWGIAFSPDGRRLATSGSDRSLQLRDLRDLDHPLVLTGHDDEVWSVAWSRDGRQLATASKDMTVRFWSAQPPHDSLEAPNAKYWLPALSRDGHRMLTGDTFADGSVHVVLRDMRTGGAQAEFPGRWIAAFAPDSNDVMLVDDENGRLEKWSAVSAKIVSTTPLLEAKWPSQLRGFAFASDGAAFAAANGKEIHVWRVSDGARMAAPLKVPPEGLLALALSPRGRYLAWSAPVPYVIRLHDLRSGRVSVLTNHTEEVKGLTFSPDGRLLASASVDGFVRLWNTADGRPLAELARHVEEASGVAFSPDGRTLASIGVEQSIKLWHVPTAREVASLPMPDASARIVFSPDGDTLAFTTQSNTVRLLQTRPPETK